MKVAKQKLLESQIVKKQLKNKSRLPRTAGLRTLSELSGAMTKAGLDPSRIQERAETLAKIRAEQGKRKRDQDDEMDIDMGAGGSDGENEDGWMDVDDEENGTPKKRAKINSGEVMAITGKREPRSNRQLAGMRDSSVGSTVWLSFDRFANLSSP